MSRNGSGVYSPSATGYPAVASTTIESAKYNAVIADIGTALTGSIACNGESTITGNIPMATYKITGLGDATAAKDAMNRDASDARFAKLSGGLFTGTVNITATIAQVTLNESDAATDEKEWHLRASGGDFYLYTATDAGSSAGTPLAITRTGTTVDSIAMTATALTVNAIDVTPTQGSFTMELATASSGGSVLASGTAYWKKRMGVVTMRCPGLTAITTDNTLFIRAIPAACQAGALTTTQIVAVPGVVNGVSDMIGLYINPSQAYWDIVKVFTAIGTASDTKGIGYSASVGPTIVYHTT